MTTPSDLAVVLCHGSYHTPEPYQALLDSLKARGIDAYCPQLPTSDLSKLNIGDVSNPDYDIGPPSEGYPQGEQDIEVIHTVLRPLIEEQGKRVIVVGHSSGGWSATQSAIPELQLKEREKSGLKGGVIGVFYIGAFLIPVGLSVHAFFQLATGGQFVPPPFLTFYVSTYTSLLNVFRYSSNISIETWARWSRDPKKPRGLLLPRH
jgi:pimeloyl-ACP methyl ester carboxylesterase